MNVDAMVSNRDVMTANDESLSRIVILASCPKVVSITNQDAFVVIMNLRD